MRGAGGEGAVGAGGVAAVVGVGERREDERQVGGERRKGLEAHGRGARRAGAGEVADEHLLQREFERRHARVGVDEFVERGGEAVARRGIERAEGGQGELEERELERGVDRGDGGKQGADAGRGGGGVVAADEGEAAFGARGVGGEDERVGEGRGDGGVARGAAQGVGHGGEAGLGLRDLLFGELADGGDDGGRLEGDARGAGSGLAFADDLARDGGRTRRGGGARGVRGGCGARREGGEGFAFDVDDGGRRDELAVPLRVDGADALVERRVRRPESAEEGAEALGEEEVRELRGVGVGQARTERVAADLFQGAGDAGGVARELDGGGVGEEFALARHGGLDEAAEEIAHVADDEQRETDGEDESDAAALALAVAARADAAAAEGAEDAATEEAEHENAEDDGGQLHVEPHVAVEDVGELVADDALEFVAREFFQRAARDGDSGVGGGEAGSERI